MDEQDKQDKTTEYKIRNTSDEAGLTLPLLVIRNIQAFASYPVHSVHPCSFIGGRPGVLFSTDCAELTQ
jgi:hypothetical protein